MCQLRCPIGGTVGRTDIILAFKARKSHTAPESLDCWDSLANCRMLVVVAVTVTVTMTVTMTMTMMMMVVVAAVIDGNDS